MRRKNNKKREREEDEDEWVPFEDRKGSERVSRWIERVSRGVFLVIYLLLLVTGSLSSVEKSGRFVVVKSAEGIELNENGNVKETLFEGFSTRTWPCRSEQQFHHSGGKRENTLAIGQRLRCIRQIRWEHLRSKRRVRWIDCRECTCQERDHRPRTVLEQLYNYKGGIVPNAVEAEKPAAPEQVVLIVRTIGHFHRSLIDEFPLNEGQWLSRSRNRPILAPSSVFTFRVCRIYSVAHWLMFASSSYYFPLSLSLSQVLSYSFVFSG